MTSGNFKIIKDKKKRKINKKPIIIAIVAVLLIAASVAAYFLYADWRDKKIAKEQEENRQQVIVDSISDVKSSLDSGEKEISEDFMHEIGLKYDQYSQDLKGKDVSSWNKEDALKAYYSLVYAYKINATSTVVYYGKLLKESNIDISDKYIEGYTLDDISAKLKEKGYYI